VQSAGFTRLVRVTACSKCEGRGYTIESPCGECRGRGSVERTRKIKITIPAGVEEGLTLRLRGEGNAGESGAPPGDLYVALSVAPHRLFKRHDSDVYLDANVGVVEALLGTELTVPTLYGDVKLSVPHGTQPGTVFRIKGKGLPKQGSWGKGDQYVRVGVEIPRSLNGEQKELLKRFRDAA
jgi:molecular chaperone DnaJ